jgi:alpha-beta hydrolase superfamily lysophospholipase
MCGPGISERRFGLVRPDGETIAAYRWSTGRPPRAVVAVSHGMGEHARRYPPALSKLLDSGIDIYGIDHRGHGTTLALSNLSKGDFGSGGFAALVADLAALLMKARSENPRLPLFLLGHSMGSFIGQAFLIDHSALVDGAVLVGTAPVDLLAQGMAREPDALAALNRPFEPARTAFDWLSSVESEVDAYIDDPLCGFSLVPESMTSLLSQGARLADPSQLARIRAGLPLYILIGGRDPLTTVFGELGPLVDRYRRAGIDPVVAVYAEGRHEILNEVNRDQVVSELRAWLDQVIASHSRSAGI